MSATDLWADVKSRYDEQSLIGLTNPRVRGANTVDDTKGEQAAQDIIDYFPIDVQITFDYANPQHKQVGIQGVIAMLWRQGGTAANAERVKWEDWEAIAAKLKMIEPRAHGMPSVGQTLADQQASAYGYSISWASPRCFRGLLPRPCSGRYSPYGGPDEWQ